MSVSVNTYDFATEVLEPGVPTLVDFWAPWCPPCRQMLPVVDALGADSNGEYRVAKVNVDEAPELAERYGVQSIPTFVVFADGRAQRKLVGVFTRHELRQHLIDVSLGR